MPTTGKGIPIRHGTTICYARDAMEAARIMVELETGAGHSQQQQRQEQQQVHLDTGAGDNLDIARLAADTTKRLHALILQSCPSLVGKAAKNFGTALRAAQVRQLFSGVGLREVELLQWLEYVANAADAHRHLSSTIVFEVEALVALTLHASAPTPLDPRPQPPPPPTSCYAGAFVHSSCSSGSASESGTDSSPITGNIGASWVADPPLATTCDEPKTALLFDLYNDEDDTRGILVSRLDTLWKARFLRGIRRATFLTWASLLRTSDSTAIQLNGDFCHDDFATEQHANCCHAIRPHRL